MKIVRPDEQTVNHFQACVVPEFDIVILVLEVAVVVQVVVVLRAVASTSVSTEMEVSWRTRDDNTSLGKAQMKEVIGNPRAVKKCARRQCCVLSALQVCNVCSLHGLHSKWSHRQDPASTCFQNFDLSFKTSIAHPSSHMSSNTSSLPSSLVQANQTLDSRTAPEESSPTRRSTLALAL